MGTDIHLAVERRDRDGRWHLVPNPVRPCPGYLHDKSSDPRGKCYWCHGTGTRTEAFFVDRNYDVFAILADVRNGFGFAGCITGTGFTAISKPRGLPDDMSEELQRLSTETDKEGCTTVWLGDHSFSTLTVEEILGGNPHPDTDHYWLLRTRHQGVVGPAEYLKWKKDGRPQHWCGDVSGHGVRKVSNAEMAALILRGAVTFAPVDAESTLVPGDEKATDGLSCYTTVEWTETYAEAAASFLAMVFADLMPLGDPKDTRIVFGFDS